MNILVVAFVTILIGCAQLMKGETQPVVIKDANQQIMFTTCSGTVEDWGSCNSKARSACKNGYAVVNKVESAVGGKRELTFKCN